MPLTKLHPSTSPLLTDERLAQLRSLLPEAFADGKINWDTLREALGETLEDDSQEHFGLFWPGKREARRLASLPSKGTLIPQPGQGVDEDATHNLFIEGDNLEVLKLLQKSYAGRVKLIYIDPPYNTGVDFVYPDDFSEPLESYLKRTGQMDESGKMLTTNSKSSGRFHTNWLNMMYPRLRIGRELLKDDGIIFVSIDDNEIHNLRCLMNEIFGEENFVAQITIQSNPRGRQSERFVATVHEYVLAYAKNADMCIVEGVPLTPEQAKEFKFKDDDGRIYRLLGLRQRGSASRREDRPNMYYPVYVNPQDATISLIRSDKYTEEVLPKKSTGEDGRWMWGSERVNQRLDKMEAKLISSRNEWDIFVRDYLASEDGDDRTRKFKTIWDEKEINYQNGTKELKELFATNRTLVDYPKPTYLIKQVIRMGGGEPGEIYLDFFSGSGTTAHTVLEMNRSEGLQGRFFVVQLPESTPLDSDAKKEGFPTIAEIGKERIRRVIRKLKKESQGALDLYPNEDLGFKSYKLSYSNFTEWQPYTERDTSQLELRFTQAESPLVAGWTLENLLAEILLLQGFPLDSRARPLDEFKSNRVLEVASEFCQHRLYVCLDPKIQPETVQALKLRPEDILVTLDSALTDEAKITLADQVNLKVI
jgi:adenine-specific DNA-methyltransferase